jgi:outer membrane protein OmpA-like peptidoglycan-associated protein
MFPGRAGTRRRVRDEAEKPFWISFADLMTALMVLFLVVMSVALLAATRKLTESEQAVASRNAEISSCLDQLQSSVREFSGVTIDLVGNKVNFGERASFGYNSAALSEDNRRVLQEFVPRVLAMAELPCGKRWLRRVVVEGFTDRTGSYLYNLDLSLRRSQSVLCALVDPDSGLSVDQRNRVRDLFLVGGYAFNMGKQTDEESRRIELRLEFFDIGEEQEPSVSEASTEFGRCQVRS